MRSKTLPAATDHDLVWLELMNLIDSRYELVRLAALIEWSVYEREFGVHFASTTGRPALPTRPIAGCCT